jgi:hypothetical protein
LLKFGSFQKNISQIITVQGTSLKDNAALPDC